MYIKEKKIQTNSDKNNIRLVNRAADGCDNRPTVKRDQYGFKLVGVDVFRMLRGRAVFQD